MASQEPEKKAPSAGLSAFASLLDPNSKGISKSPVLYNQEQKEEQKEDKPASSAALAFKPVKRPVVKQPAKPRPGAVISKPPTFYKQDSGNGPTPAAVEKNGSPEAPAEVPVDGGPPVQNANHKPTLQDWMDTMPEDEDAAAAYVASKQQQRGGGRSTRKRKREQEKHAKAQEEAELTNWKGIYDPSKPNHYQLYKGSDEFYDMVDEWKDFLHSRAQATGRKRRTRDDAARQAASARNPAFAPPSGMSFAPPAMYDEDAKPMEDDDEAYEPPPPAAAPPDDATGDDAYARRTALSSGAMPPPPPPPPPPAVEEDEEMEDYEPPSPFRSPPRPEQAPASVPGSVSREPVRYQVPPPPPDAPGVISREPVRYEATSQPVADDVPIEEPPPMDQSFPHPSSKRPGQKDFAKRMLAKMGWQEGSGLGAQGTGIATPLSVQLDKRLKRSNQQGGGFMGPSGKGRIVGGKMSKEGKAAEQAAKEETERVGELSEIVALDHMLDGQNLDDLLSEMDFYQQLGDECGQNYGRVERVYVQREGEDRGRVFVKFVEKMSAMRALKGFQDREFGGNVIEARYFNPQKFEREIMGI